jgi:hypothetical protein
MYSLETPIKRKVFEIKEEPKQIIEPRGANSEQSHRIWSWLFHKPQQYSETPRGEQTRNCRNKIKN